MIKFVTPKPFFYEGDERAVLLLHSFTSTTSGMKRLANYLNSRGYTCHVPLYRGHGEAPEQFLKTTLRQWWEDAEAGFHYLQARGYQNIAVIGVSMGGLFTLKLAQQETVKGIVTMSVPNHDAAAFLPQRFYNYVTRYLALEGLSAVEIEAHAAPLNAQAQAILTTLVTLIDEVHSNVDKIVIPARLLYGGQDRPLYKASAELLLDHLTSEDKRVIGYSHAGHLMTVGEDAAQLNEDIFNFLETLDW